MKMNRLNLALSAGVLAVCFGSCKNAEQSFPDYDGGTTAYFAYQYPIRTLILGNVETYDNTSDNEGRFTIYGTFGGSYSGINAKIDVAIDETLANGLEFEDGTPVKPMPKDYYEISGNQLDYGGNYRGGVEIKLNDKFFDDTLSVSNNYVIPLVMGDFSGVDKINRGVPMVDGSSPLRQDPSKWDTQPKDFVLFCVNYINKYNATFLRHGCDYYDDMKYSYDTIGYNSYVAIHAGDKKENPWDTQFWISVDHDFVADEEWEVSFDAKATTDTIASTQTHSAPGTYVDGAGFGNVSFPKDWKTFKASGKFTAAQAKDGAHSIAFNLNEMSKANVYCLDNVSFKINGVEYITNIECNDVACDNFFSKESNGATVNSSYESEPIVVMTPTGYEKNKEYRHGQYIEYDDEVVYTKTKSKNSIVVPITTTEVNGTPFAIELLLTFDENGNCTVKSNTPGVKAEGTGKYLENSEKLAWGNKDRDGLYIDYTVDLYDAENDFTVHYATSDTLVWRDRGTAAAIQTFSPKYVGE